MNLDWLAEQGLERLPDFLTALAIGLMMGLERERNPTAKGGLRTFAIISLTGATAAFVANLLNAPLMVAAGLVAVAFTIIAAYFPVREPASETDPGTTTIVAAIACYLFGALTVLQHAQLAVILAIIVTALLYFKTELGGFAHSLERRDLISVLQFSIVTFVILPVLPDRPFGPFAVLNPRNIWLMVVLVSGVSMMGYIALRAIGQKYGAMVLGLFGGLVSSTATTIAYSRHTHNQSDLGEFSWKVIATASLVLLGRLALLAAVIAPGVLAVLLPILGIALVLGTAVFALGWRLGNHTPALAVPDIANPAELRTALGFGALYAVVLLLTAWLRDWIGQLGVYGMAVVSGVADVDAISLSSLHLFGTGSLSAAQTATAMAIAIVVNIIFKLGIVLVVGGRKLFLRCLPGMGAIAVGIGIGVLLLT